MKFVKIILIICLIILLIYIIIPKESSISTGVIKIYDCKCLGYEYSIKNETKLETGINISNVKSYCIGIKFLCELLQ